MNKNEQKILFDLFEAYYDARQNKRNKYSQLKFELQYESFIFKLFADIINYSYKPSPSICFVVDKPVLREIFAADFRDRVIHHFIYNYIYSIFEKTFINDSYSCRIGKGTHYGINRIDKFIRSCSQNYSKDCYILKLDIKGYFMSMNKILLFHEVKSVLLKNKHKITFDLDLILYLIEKTIFNDPKENCIIKGKKSDWHNLPKTKSLFHANSNCGLPIGNLTSQLFGNVYLNDFDHWVKKDLGIRYYGRYVDDFVIIHSNKDYLQNCIQRINEYLKETVNLQLHPNKIYLQHFSKGVQYLGAIIKPHRIYIVNRTKGNFFEAIQCINKVLAEVPQFSWQQLCDIRAILNSYLGTLSHAYTFNIRKAMLDKLRGRFHDFFFVSDNIDRVIINKDFWEWHFSPNYLFDP